jgi:hypothetical protein
MTLPPSKDSANDNTDQGSRNRMAYVTHTQLDDRLTALEARLHREIAGVIRSDLLRWLLVAMTAQTLLLLGGMGGLALALGG